MEDLPLLFGKETDSRQLILSVLNKKWPLNARQIHREIEKSTSALVTYQAIHKMLKQLESEGVVTREPKGFALSPTWVSSLFSFSKSLQERHSKELPSLADLPKNTVETVNFNDCVVTPYYWLLNEVCKIAARRKEKTACVMHLAGAWPITMLTEEENEQMKLLSGKAAFYILCNTDTPTDKYFQRFWQDYFKAKWKYAPEVAKKCDLLVLYDFIIQKYDSPAMVRNYGRLWAKPKVDLPGIYKLVFEHKSKLKLVITRNQQLADSLRKDTLKLFGGK